MSAAVGARRCTRCNGYTASLRTRCCSIWSSDGVTRAVGKIVASQIAVWDEAYENGPSHLVPPLTIVAVDSGHSSSPLLERRYRIYLVEHPQHEAVGRGLAVKRHSEVGPYHQRDIIDRIVAHERVVARRLAAVKI